MKKLLALLLLSFGLWQTHADTVSKYRFHIDVSSPQEESFLIQTATDEVSSVKRDTVVVVNGKTVEFGYHLQFTPHLHETKPYVKVYIKSIIRDASSVDSAIPGFAIRTQSLKVYMTPTGDGLTGSGTAFDKDPVTFTISLPSL